MSRRRPPLEIPADTPLVSLEPLPPLRTNRRHKISESKKQKVFERDGFRCVYCSTDQDLTIDHKTAVAHGGTNELRNLQTACRPCNRLKGSGARP